MSRKTQPLPTTNKLPVSSTARDTSPFDATGSQKSPQKPRAPGRKASQPRAKKPKLRTVAGTYWRADGDGWELRKSGGQNDPDKDRYLGRLSGKRYVQMKAEFGRDFPEALANWVKAKAAEKRIDL